jgi:hypothetical protein
MAILTRMQLCGAAITVIGAGLIAYAQHSINKANAAKGTIDKFTNFFSHNPTVWNPLVTFFGGKAEEQASQYDTTLTVLFYLGIGLVVIGLWSLFWFRRRA